MKCPSTTRTAGCGSWRSRSKNAGMASLKPAKTLRLRASILRLCCLYLYYCAVRLLSYYVALFLSYCVERDWSRLLGSAAPHPVADKLISLFLRQVDLASASESLCRGLGSRWLTERFHRNALVTHFQHGQVFCTARQLKDYAVTRCRLHQRAPQRGHPTDVVAVEIDLVGAHDAHHSLRSRGMRIAHGRSEECPRRRLPCSRSFRVNHFRGLDSLREKANPSIDLPQPPLAV